MTQTSDLLDGVGSALEQRDLDLMMSLFADDAELKVIDQRHPPSNPLELHGKGEIGDYFRDIFGRDMSHHIEDRVVENGHAALTDACRYADGKRVFVMSTVETEGGKIVRETNIQAWDD